MGYRALVVGGAALVAVCTVQSPMRASAAGNPKTGLQIAQRWCASCHLVAPEQRAGSADVPTFQAIARREDLTEALLTAFLSSSHPRMPDMALSRQEIADLVAYIRSVR